MNSIDPVYYAYVMDETAIFTREKPDPGKIQGYVIFKANKVKVLLGNATACKDLNGDVKIDLSKQKLTDAVAIFGFCNAFSSIVFDFFVCINT